MTESCLFSNALPPEDLKITGILVFTGTQYPCAQKFLQTLGNIMYVQHLNVNFFAA